MFLYIFGYVLVHDLKTALPFYFPFYHEYRHVTDLMLLRLLHAIKCIIVAGDAENSLYKSRVFNNQSAVKVVMSTHEGK